MHIGFIVDGNRRWARSHGLATIEGHKKGLEKIEMTVAELAKSGIDYASFYVFSTENWGRSEEEVGNLMNLAGKEVVRLAKKMAKNNIRCVWLGSRAKISEQLKAKLEESEEITKDCSGLTVCFCFNYGGQQEIVDAAKSLALTYNQDHDDTIFTAENLEKHLYHPEIPPLDLVVRTSGEERISGFMLWRIAYAEFLFLDKLYPDLEPTDIKDILAEYDQRNRRYGK